MSKPRRFYMHTIDHRPALYWPGEQICFAGHYTGKRLPPLATSLKQIREEQRLSNAWRKKEGCDERSDYGYVTVGAP